MPVVHTVLHENGPVFQGYPQIYPQLGRITRVLFTPGERSVENYTGVTHAPRASLVERREPHGGPVVGAHAIQIEARGGWRPVAIGNCVLSVGPGPWHGARAVGRLSGSCEPCAVHRVPLTMNRERLRSGGREPSVRRCVGGRAGHPRRWSVGLVVSARPDFCRARPIDRAWWRVNGGRATRRRLRCPRSRWRSDVGRDVGRCLGR